MPKRVASKKRVSTRRIITNKNKPKFTPQKNLRDPRFALQKDSNTATIDWEAKDKEYIITFYQSDDPIISGRADYLAGRDYSGAVIAEVYDSANIEDKNVIVIQSNPTTRELMKTDLERLSIKQLRDDYYIWVGKRPLATMDKIRLIEGILDVMYE